MKNLLKPLPGRRLELGLTVLSIVGLSILIWWRREDPAMRSALVLTTLELMLPLGLGIVTAGLLADDPALDLLLSVPQPAPRTLTQRLGIVLGCGLALSLAVQGLADLWGIPLPIRGLQQILIWATPTSFLTGIAVASSLVRGRMSDGLTAVLGAWGAMLVSIPIVDRACLLLAGKRCVGALFCPALTQIRPLDGNWALNRLIWLSAGLLLLGIGLALAGDEERLVGASRVE